MITGLEVGAVFKIVDEATITLRRMAEQVSAFDKVVIEARKNLLGLGRVTFPGLSGELKVLNEQAETLRATFGSTFKAIDSEIAGTTAEVNTLASAWVRVATEAKAAATAMRTPGIAGAGTAGAGGVPRHGRPSVGGLHLRSDGIPIPGAHASVGGSPASLGAGVAAAYSIYEALEVENIVAKGLANVSPEGLPADAEAKKKELTQKIIDEARIVKLPLQTVAKMALDELKTNANQPWESRMRMMPLVIENAAREAYIKDTNPEAATTAFVGQLHQLQVFTPAEMEKMGPELAYFMAKDPNALTKIGPSMGYHTALLTSMLGIPAEQDIAAQVVLDRTGVGGKSGTWLREMGMRAAKPKHDKSYAAKMAQLKEFGLMDAEDHPTWMTDGHYDEQKMLHIVADHLRGMPIEDRGAKLKGIWGERGSGAVALMTMPKMLAQYDQLLAESREIQSTADFWKVQNATNPMQKMKGALVDAQAAALAAGQVLTPPAVGAAGIAADALGWAAQYLPAPGSEGAKRGEAMGAGGVAGGAIGAGVGLLGGPVGVVGGAILGTAIGADLGYMLGDLGASARAAASALWGLVGGGKPGTNALPDSTLPHMPPNATAAPEKHSMNFIPPPQGQRPIVLSSVINLDGQTIADNTQRAIAGSMEHPTTAAYADGSRYAWDGGMQTNNT